MRRETKTVSVAGRSLVAGVAALEWSVGRSLPPIGSPGRSRSRAGVRWGIEVLPALAGTDGEAMEGWQEVNMPRAHSGRQELTRRLIHPAGLAEPPALASIPVPKSRRLRHGSSIVMRARFASRARTLLLTAGKQHLPFWWCLMLCTWLCWSNQVAAQFGGGPGMGPSGGGPPPPTPTKTVNPSLWVPTPVKGDEPVVKEVRVEGNRSISTRTILSKLQTQPGRPYRDDIVQNDVRELFKNQWFYNVSVLEPQVTAEGVIVTFRVMEQPILEAVEFLGNQRVSEKTLRNLSGLRPGMPIGSGMAQTAIFQIRKYYLDKGYALAQVELVEGDKPQDRRVVIQIHEGPITRIRNIIIKGNQFVSDQRLRAVALESGRQFPPMIAMPTIGNLDLAIGGKFQPEKLELDKAKLMEYYRSFGFLDVKVDEEVTWSEDKRNVDLTFHIQEGLRYIVRKTSFEGNEIFQTPKLNEQIQLTSGTVFDQKRLSSDLRALQDTYGNEGYIQARIQPDIRYRDTPGEVDIVYQINETTPKRIGQIFIEGNSVTKSRVIEQIMDIGPGDLASTVDIRRSQAMLNGARIFAGPPQGSPPTVQFAPTNNPESEFQDLLVRVEEGQTGSFLLGIGVNSDSGVGGSIVLNERNFDIARLPRSFDDILEGRAFRGAGQEFRLEAIPGDRVHRYSVTFSEPRLLGTNLGLTTRGYWWRRLFTNYDEDRQGGALTLSRRFSRTLSGSLSYRGENVKITDPRAPVPTDLIAALGNHTLHSFDFGLSHNTLDSFINPGSGHILEGSYQQTVGDFDFPRLEFSARQFFTTYSRADGSGRHVLSLRGQVAYSGSQTPIFERFYAGGTQSIRGFEFRGVGPVENDVELGGNFQLLAGAQYQIPLDARDSLAAVVFLDSGTVETDVEINNYRVSAGFGLRIQIPQMGPVPMALDFGFPIVKADFDDRELFHFFIGIGGS